MKEKKIEDYIHLYLGCEAITDSGLKGKIVKIDTNYQLCTIEFNDQGQTVSKPFSDVKLLLRQLPDMTTDESQEAHAIYYVDRVQLLAIMDVAHFELCRYLLSKGFDLFELIPAGLALDKTLVKN